MTVKGVVGRRWLWVFAIVVALAGIVALNWHSFLLMTAIAISERRPALLSDADWNAPASAHAFKERFPPGTPEAQLLEWLESNNFAIDWSAGQAERLVRSLPCNEYIQITWTRSPPDKLGDVEARVTEAGCL